MSWGWLKMRIRVIIVTEAKEEIAFTFNILPAALNFIHVLVDHSEKHVLNLRIEKELTVKDIKV